MVPISKELLVIACTALLWGVGIGSERRGDDHSPQTRDDQAVK